MIDFPALDFELGETIDMLRASVRQFARGRDRAARRGDRPRQRVSGGPVAQDGRPRPARHHRRGSLRRRRRSATSRTSSRWRRSRARPRRSACRTARTRTCASTRSAATAARRRSSSYLPKLISGEHVGALAMSESGSGSDVVSMRLRAEPRGDDYVLNGTQDVDHQRSRRGHARRLREDRCRRPGRAASRRSSSRRACTGFSTAQKLDKLGMRGSNTCELVFDDCEVPAANVLGEDGRGVNVLMSGLDYERAVLAGGLARHHGARAWTSCCRTSTSGGNSASRSASSS